MSSFAAPAAPLPRLRPRGAVPAPAACRQLQSANQASDRGHVQRRRRRSSPFLSFNVFATGTPVRRKARLVAFGIWPGPAPAGGSQRSGATFVAAEHAAARTDDHEILLAVIGDVHEQWGPADVDVLRALRPDLTLFVGDFAEENEALIREIASYDLPKCVVLGNHDAQYSMDNWGKNKYIERFGGEDGHDDDRFGRILESLGEDHVGFGVRDFPELDISVVGGRPCSWGGAFPAHCAPFFERYFGGVPTAEASSLKIFEAAKRARCRNLVFLSHNGPYGLGDRPSDPVGRDWGNTPGGDQGDPDLAEAMRWTREELEKAAEGDTGAPRTVLLSAFGHMHRLLQNKQGMRRMVHRDEHGVVHVNAAHVPRTRPHVAAPGGTLHSVTLVTVGGMPCAPAVMRVRHVWVDSVEKQIREDELLFELDDGTPGNHPVLECELPA
eukprot:tig00021179_g19257.t1